MTKVWQFYAQSARRNPTDLWISIVTVLLTLVLGVGVLVSSTDFAFAVLAAQVLLGALDVRFGFQRATRPARDARGAKVRRSQPDPDAAFPAFLLLVPLVTTALGFWWIMPGLQADDTPPVMALLLWLIISYAAMLLSILVAAFLLFPLELVGRGLIQAIRGRFAQAVPLVVGGIYILLVPAFGVAGALALDDLPPFPFAGYGIIAGLLGVDGRYSIESEGWLWVTRLLFVLILIPLLGLLRVRRDRRNDSRADAA